MIKRAPDGTYYAEHSPGANLDYAFDWSDWLETGETVATSEWTVPTGVTKTREAKNAENSKTSVYLEIAGTSEGQEFIVKNQIVTSAPFSRKEIRSLKLLCRRR